MRRKVCVISGTRAEYGLLRPVMRAINEHKDLELLLMVTGMHFSNEFGKTVDLIRKDGFKIAYKVKMHPKKDKAGSMAKAIGRGIVEITKAFEKKRPDICLILGDRTEALAGAIASAYLNIPVAHIHGGDISKAGLDESARHAITKLAHIHFAATKTSKQRILKMGENPKNVHLTGAPGLDSILNEKHLSKKELLKVLNINSAEPYIVLLQHSVTTQIEDARSQIQKTLRVIKGLKMTTLVIYPNSDAGGRVIIREIEALKGLPFIRIHKNFPHKHYLSLLKHAELLIGNSSSGIIESSSFKLPVINIGIRQDCRERSVNVIDVGHDEKEIKRAIKKAFSDKRYRKRVVKCKNPYGKGKAGKKIAKVLSEVEINKDMLQKQLSYE